MRNGLLLCFLICVLSGTSRAHTPAFEDYAVSEKFRGKPARLTLSQADRPLREKLRKAANGTANFAGHYILAIWSCGSECLTGAVIDAKTGRYCLLPVC